MTGGAGFIGRHLVWRLVEEGAHVVALDVNIHREKLFAKNTVYEVRADVTNPSSARTAVKGCSMVFHCAAVICDYRPKAYYWRVNAEGTKNVAEKAMEEGVERFLQISSNIVYGFSPGFNIDESCPRRVFGGKYSDSKLEAEQIIAKLIREKDLPGIIVQPTVVYGPFDNNWTQKGLKLIARNLLLIPDGRRGIFQPIYVSDLVEGLILAMVKGSVGENYILAGPDVVTFREFYERLSIMVSKNRIFSAPKSLCLLMASFLEFYAKVRRKPPLLNREAIKIATMRSTYNSAKAYRDLGFRAKIRLNEGMKFVRDWFEQNKTQILR